MNVLALDPGPIETGFALLWVHPGERTRLDHGEHVATCNVLPWLHFVLPRGHIHVDLVVVERPMGAWGKTPQEVAAKSIDVGDTAFEAGQLVRGARDLGLRVKTARATSWRPALLSFAKQLGWRPSGEKKDKDIAGALRALKVEGASKTNVHVRDALGLGLVVGMGLCESEEVI